MGRAFYMRGNKGTQTPVNLVFVDTESWINRHPEFPNKKVLTLRLWHAIRVRLENEQVTRRREASGIDAAGFWTFLKDVSNPRHCTWVFAHNLGHDLTQLGFWELIDNGTFQRDGVQKGETDSEIRPGRTRKGKFCLDSHPTFIVCRRDRTWHRFVDTCNYWRLPLSTLGEAISLPQCGRPEYMGLQEDWARRCKSDTEIIERAITELLLLWRREDCGVFQMTAAGLAFTNFRHTCNVRNATNGHVDIVCEPDSEQHKLERLAYYGGRTTCYAVGRREERVYHLDCNSLYPYVMRDGLYPRRFVRYSRSESIEDLTNGLAIYGGVADVTVRTSDRTYPMRINGRTFYVTGTFRTALCGEELQSAVENGDIEKCHLVQYYSVAMLFRSYVDYWYDRKMAADSKGIAGRAEREFAKIMLNSLSGKFAQNGRHWRDRPDVICPETWSAWAEWNVEEAKYVEYRTIGRNVQTKEEGREPDHSFPAISAFITSAAREYMRWVMDACGRQHIYYSATDSIICNRNGFENLLEYGLVDNVQIGKFKLQGVYDSITIHGPNYYQTGEKVVCSGWLGKYIRSQMETGHVEIWERLPSIISNGPQSSCVITEEPVKAYSPDFRGLIDSSGRWQPYSLPLFDSEAERSAFGTYLREYWRGIASDRTPVLG